MGPPGRWKTRPPRTAAVEKEETIRLGLVAHTRSQIWLQTEETLLVLTAVAVGEEEKMPRRGARGDELPNPLSWRRRCHRPVDRRLRGWTVGRKGNG